MIKLTSIYARGGWPIWKNPQFSPDPVYVNPKEIMGMKESVWHDYSLILREPDHPYTSVFLHGGVELDVQESAKEILKQIEEKQND